VSPGSAHRKAVLASSTQGEEALLVVARELEEPELRELLRFLRAVPPRARVTVDFRRATVLQDFAVVAAAQAIAEGGAVVRFLGLSQHHQRLLEYAGARSREPAGASAGDGS